MRKIKQKEGRVEGGKQRKCSCMEGVEGHVTSEGMKEIFAVRMTEVKE